MLSNLGIIKGGRIQTSNGVYLCIGLWMKGFNVTAFDFIKYYSEPTVTDVLTIEQTTIVGKLEAKEISVL